MINSKNGEQVRTIRIRLCKQAADALDKLTETHKANELINALLLQACEADGMTDDDKLQHFKKQIQYKGSVQCNA